MRCLHRIRGEFAEKGKLMMQPGPVMDASCLHARRQISEDFGMRALRI